MESIMMQWPMELENKVRKCMIEYRKFIVMETVFGIAVYFMLISENLVNSNDGIWHISRSIAGEWETSLGRGLLFYFDKMRFGLVSVPFNTILTLLIISITNAIILDLFKETQGTLGIVLTMIFIANPITCDTLSYCYTSVNYGLAFLFSVIAVKCIAYSNWSISILLGGCFIAVSLGCYQAYFGVTCLLLLMLLLKKILQDIAVKEMVDFILRCICSIITGGIIYYILSNILLNQSGIELASYRGASEVSVSRIIVSLPTSVQACYQCFYEFFCKNSMYVISKKALLVLAGIGAIVLLAAVQNFMMVWHKNKIYAMGFIIGICLVPIACNMIILIAVGNGIDVLMAMGMVMNLVLLIAILPSETKSGLFMRKMGIVLLFCLLWLNVLTVTNDQLALKEGKTATVGLTESIIDRLIAGGYLEDGANIALVGKPSENDLFVKKSCWENANNYAQFGAWMVEPGNNYRSWSGVLLEYFGVKLNVCPAEKYEELRQRDEIASMPLFPMEGSITRIDGVVVVKVSEAY